MRFITLKQSIYCRLEIRNITSANKHRPDVGLRVSNVQAKVSTLENWDIIEAKPQLSEAASVVHFIMTDVNQAHTFVSRMTMSTSPSFRQPRHIRNSLNCKGIMNILSVLCVLSVQNKKLLFVYEHTTKTREWHEKHLRTKKNVAHQKPVQNKPYFWLEMYPYKPIWWSCDWSPHVGVLNVGLASLRPAVLPVIKIVWVDRRDHLM